TKDGFSPSSKSYSRIFLLGDALVAHLTDPARIGKSPGCISYLTSKLMDCLVWGERTIPSGRQETAILEFAIKTVVHDETKDLPYREYIAETQGLVQTQKVIRAYRLDPPSLTEDQRRIRTEQIRNQSYALEKIGSHPNIFPTDSRIIESAQQFFEIFDYLPESSLRDIWKKRELTYEEKLEITFGLCAALKAAHEAKVIHRAVRPENVIYISHVARLANFTEAFFDEHIQAGFTIPRSVDEKTVTAYDAPELAEHKMTAASDIYSFGVFLYELFLGKVPVANFYKLNQLGGKLPENLMPTSINALLPSWLDTVVGKAVVFDPNGRWRSVSEIHDFIRGEISASVTPGAREAAAAETPQELEAGMMATPELYLVEQLGSGGYSKVFRAHHRLQDSDFALKIYNESVSVRSATDEYRVLSALNHKNIVKFVYNGLTNNGRFYTMMELVKGPNLSKFTSQGDLHLPLRDVYRLADNILDALTYLQSLKVPVFHRDIKPQNILCDEARDRFVLTDFNISAIAD
ncbi:MAG: protein kinase, partial [Kiritimatiellae bacterium]|nr:protein kinase [Kiritimatiellia bacterium]